MEFAIVLIALQGRLKGKCDWEQEAKAVLDPTGPSEVALAWMSWRKWDVKFSFSGGLVSIEMHF